MDDHVDKNDHPVRQITTKKITTKTIVDGKDIDEPRETFVLPQDHLAFPRDTEGLPVKVENIKDDKGYPVTKITRKTIVTKQVKRDDVVTNVSEPIEIGMPTMFPRQPVVSVNQRNNLNKAFLSILKFVFISN